MEINLRLHILALPRLIKRLVVILVDALLAGVSVWLAFYLRIGDFLPLFTQTAEHVPLIAVIGAVGMSIPIFMVSGLYRTVFRYSGGAALIAVGQACAFYSLIFATLFTVIGMDGVPRTVGIIQPLILFILIAASRMNARLWLGGLYREHLKQNKVKRVLIYGAGVAGRELAAGLSHNAEIKIIGFLDDDKSLHGSTISGVRVLDPNKTQEYAEKLLVNEIMLALPSVGLQKRNKILSKLREANFAVRALPSYSDLAQGRVTVNDILELSIDEILGRDIVTPDDALMRADIKDKVVMVTGAGGSIGSELCRNIIKQTPKRILLFEQNEYSLYSIHSELEKKLNADTLEDEIIIIPILGSVTDKDRVNQVLENHCPQTIYHAAAYKHVPLVEANPFEGTKNNIFGTLTLAESAIAAGVRKFILISTDKAVRPTNIMGASKRVAEMVLQSLALKGTSTVFAIVRFGNVLGSSGSVVPLFRQQISAGGPVTVTHKDVTRYFMTISEAAQLVIQAGAMSESVSSKNSVPLYLLDMGRPVRIYELARKMIEFSGLKVFDKMNPDGDIEIKVTGLRPGEKLYEELLISGSVVSTDHPKIKLAQEEILELGKFLYILRKLKKLIIIGDQNLLRTLLFEMINNTTDI